MRTLPVLFLTAALLAGIGGLTRAPYSPAASDAALLRLSWRTTVSAREHCRARTQEELDALPVHMRTPDVCEADAASYILITRIDEAAPDTVPLLRGGVKGDRPLFVLEERPLEAGRHRVRVELLRVEGGVAEPLAAPLDTVLELSAGIVRLITIDAARAALTVRG